MHIGSLALNATGFEHESEPLVQSPMASILRRQGALSIPETTRACVSQRTGGLRPHQQKSRRCWRRREGFDFSRAALRPAERFAAAEFVSAGKRPLVECSGNLLGLGTLCYRARAINGGTTPEPSSHLAEGQARPLGAWSFKPDRTCDLSASTRSCMKVGRTPVPEFQAIFRHYLTRIHPQDREAAVEPAFRFPPSWPVRKDVHTQGSA